MVPLDALGGGVSIRFDEDATAFLGAYEGVAVTSGAALPLPLSFFLRSSSPFPFFVAS
jgi:hypothetical protein